MAFDLFLQLFDEQLTDAFKIVILSPEERRKLFTSRLHDGKLENAGA